MFRLSDVIQPLSESQIETLTSKAIKRILHSEKAIAQSGMSHVSGPARVGERSHFHVGPPANGTNITRVRAAGPSEAAHQAGHTV